MIYWTKTSARALVLGACCLITLNTLAAGTNRDPLDGTGVANNPNAQYTNVIFFGSICAYHGPYEENGGDWAHVWNASLGGQGDEGFSVAFGTTFDDPDCLMSPDASGQEDVDSDPLPNEG